MDVYEKEFSDEYTALKYDLRDKFNFYVAFYNNQFNIRQQTEIVRALSLGIELDGRIYNPNIHHADMHRHRLSVCEQKNNNKDNIMIKDNDSRWVERANKLLESYDFLSSRYFMQNRNLNPKNLPEQGWKLHLSAESRKDYYELLKTIIPDFIKNNVSFKIIKPEEFLMLNTGSNRYGKEITIYPDNNFDISKFSKKTINKMFESCNRHPDTDKNFEGRINGRFGRFKQGPLKDGKGNYYIDERTPGMFAPSFAWDANLYDVLHRQQILENRLKATGDYKMYIQEYLLGTISDASSEYVFAQYCFEDINDAKSLSACLNDSNVVSIFGYHFCVVPVENEWQLDQKANSLQFHKHYFKLGDKPNYLGQLKQQLHTQTQQLTEQLR